jgi:hypothetical protein
MPDSPDLSQGAREARGVIAEKAGYRPFKALASTSDALTARCQGAAWFRASDGSTFTFAGDETNLYLMDGSTTWSDVSRLAGGDYITDPRENWRFAQFGSLAYATNAADDLQSFDLDAGANWIQAIGSPPVGRHIGVVRRFLVLANLAGFPQRVHWSGDNNPGTWASSATTLADYQDMPDGGEINGFVGGEFGLVMQESAVVRMSFEGSPTVFRFDKISAEVGATIPNCTAGWGNIAFFCHRSGFHMVQGGQQIVPIGKDKIDRWFWARVDQGNLHRVTATIDPINGLYIVSYPTGESGEPDEILIYSISANRWSYALVSCEMIFGGAVQQTWTLEDLDVFGTIEDVPYTLDSSYWTGSRQLLLAGFDGTHKSGSFSGANLAIRLETGEFQPIAGRRARVRSARPMIDGGTPRLLLGTRQTQQGAVTWTTARTVNAYGSVPFNQSGRYCRFRMNMAAGSTWEWALGIDDVEAIPAGMR